MDPLIIFRYANGKPKSQRVMGLSSARQAKPGGVLKQAKQGDLPAAMMTVTMALNEAHLVQTND